MIGINRDGGSGYQPRDVGTFEARRREIEALVARLRRNKNRNGPTS